VGWESGEIADWCLCMLMFTMLHHMHACHQSWRGYRWAEMGGGIEHLSISFPVFLMFIYKNKIRGRVQKVEDPCKLANKSCTNSALAFQTKV
jgi:hypothetical protein